MRRDSPQFKSKMHWSFVFIYPSPHSAANRPHTDNDSCDGESLGRLLSHGYNGFRVNACVYKVCDFDMIPISQQLVISTMAGVIL